MTAIKKRKTTCKNILYIVLLGSLYSNITAYDKSLFEQFKCIDSIVDSDSIKTIKQGDFLEIEVITTLTGGLLLFDPTEYIYNNNLTINIKTGSPTGSVTGCKCAKKFIYRLNLKKHRRLDEIFIVIDGVVRYTIDKKIAL